MFNYIYITTLIEILIYTALPGMIIYFIQGIQPHRKRKRDKNFIIESSPQLKFEQKTRYFLITLLFSFLIYIKYYLGITEIFDILYGLLLLMALLSAIFVSSIVVFARIMKALGKPLDYLSIISNDVYILCISLPFISILAFNYHEKMIIGFENIIIRIPAGNIKDLATLIVYVLFICLIFLMISLNSIISIKMIFECFFSSREKSVIYEVNHQKMVNTKTSKTRKIKNLLWDKAVLEERLLLKYFLKIVYGLYYGLIIFLIQGTFDIAYTFFILFIRLLSSILRFIKTLPQKIINSDIQNNLMNYFRISFFVSLIFVLFIFKNNKTISDYGLNLYGQFIVAIIMQIITDKISKKKQNPPVPHAKQESNGCVQVEHSNSVHDSANK